MQQHWATILNYVRKSGGNREAGDLGQCEAAGFSAFCSRGHAGVALRHTY